jgi:hypothetical protein
MGIGVRKRIGYLSLRKTIQDGGVKPPLQRRVRRKSKNATRKDGVWGNQPLRLQEVSRRL